MSLRLRLIIPIGVALLAILALGGTITFWEAAHQVQTEMRAAFALGEHIAQTTVDDASLAANRLQRLEGLIREFDGNRHLKAFLIGRDNRIALASKLESPDTHVPRWFHELLNRGPQTARIKLPAEFGGYEAIVLTTDASNEIAEKWSDIGLALALLVAFCMFVLGLVYWTLARGLRPLQNLSAAFVRVGRDDYGPSVPESGAIEFTRIAREFNQMVTHLRTMKLQNARLNEQLANVQEEERADLARELHDEIGPFLFAVSLDISAINQIINASNGISTQLAPRLDAIRSAIAHMQKHLKIILGRLRPTVLLDLGLAQAVDNLIDFWRGRRPDVVFNIKVIRANFGESLDEGIYRIIRESLNNALRHGCPTEIDIRVECEADDTIAINVVDDGGGMEPANFAIGFGITGMQERIALLGGTISVGNRRDGKGVVVSARLPLRMASASPTRKVEETATV